MKKLYVVLIALILGSASMNAQGYFSGDIFAGLPVGDAGDYSTFAVGADVAYMYPVSDKFDAGVTTGYSHSFGDSIDVHGTSYDLGDVQFIPIAGSARYLATPNLKIGADVGYAVGIGDTSGGGLYYAPEVSYAAGESIDVGLSYRGINEDSGDHSIIAAVLRVNWK